MPLIQERAGPYTVALTGGIASGKTTVSDAFAKLGVPVLDADVIAREVVEPGSETLRAIAEHFGEDMITATGQLDRARLRRIIFADAGQRERLEGLTHPAILQRLSEQLATITAPYCLLVVPLLVGSPAAAWADRILVVDVPVDVQIERLMARDGVDRPSAMAALSAQASRPERLEIADDIIDNSASLEVVEDQVLTLHHRYERMSSEAQKRTDYS